METENSPTVTTSSSESGTRPGEVYLVFQAALFYLEATTISLILAALTGSVAFGVFAWLFKISGLEHSGETFIALAPFVLAGLTTVVILVLVFRGFFRLLAIPAASRILCAIGAMLWALPAAIVAPALLNPILPDYKVLGIWAVYLPVAALIYWLKRRAIRI